MSIRQGNIGRRNTLLWRVGQGFAPLQGLRGSRDRRASYAHRRKYPSTPTSCANSTPGSRAHERYALICKYVVVEAGGLAHGDIAALNRQLRRNINSPGGYAPPSPSLPGGRELMLNSDRTLLPSSYPAAARRLVRFPHPTAWDKFDGFSASPHLGQSGESALDHSRVRKSPMVSGFA